MIGTDHNKMSFSNILVLPFSRTTLPAKIINLRRVSQENHVRRMKTAYQRKQIRPPFDASMNLASYPTYNNTSRCSFQAPFTTMKSSLDTSDAGYRYSFEKNQIFPSTGNRNNFSPKIIDSSNKKRDCHTKFTNLKKIENSSEFFNRNAKSDTSIDYGKSVPGEYSSYLKDKTPNVFARANKCRKETDFKNTRISSNKLGNTTSRVLQKNVNYLNDLETPKRNSLNKNNDRTDSKDYGDTNRNLTDKNSSGRKSRYSNVSKIPISLTRLPCNEQSTTRHLLLSDNSHKSSQKGKTSTSKLQIEVVIRNSTATEDNDIEEKQKKFLNAENEYRSLSDSLHGCFSRDLKYCTPHAHFNGGRDVENKEGQMLNPLSSVSSWLNDNVYTEGSNKNATLSGHSLLEDTSSVTDKRTVLRGNLNAESGEKHHLIGFKPSYEQSEDLENSSSETDQSLEYYYETGNDTVAQDGDKTKWREQVSDDEDSMVTLPISKSTGSDDSKKLEIQKANDPDYPKTPYNLRYPRYKAKECDSTKKYAENYSDAVKTPKSKPIKKSTKSTPKRKRSSKAKRNLNFKKQGQN